MNLFTRTDFLELADLRADVVVSLYLPTDRQSSENYQQDKIEFKNLLSDVGVELRDTYGWRADAIDAFLKPARELLDQLSFWQFNSDLLAVFLHADGLEIHKLPLEYPAPKYFISDRPYLRPLISMLNSDGRFLILSLRLDEIRLFQATRHVYEEIGLTDEVPQEVGEVKDLENKQKSLQFRSGHGGGGGAVFHGQGVASDEQKKDEIAEFLREVDRQITDVLKNQELPLVLAGVDYLIPIYRSVGKYNNIFPEHVSAGSPKGYSDQELHERAVGVIDAHLDTPRAQAAERYGEAAGASLNSSDKRKTLLAAWAGQVDTLFVHPEAHLWGTYDANEHTVQIDAAQTPENYCLLNEAAIQTLRNGGTVYLTAQEPVHDDTPLAAILRYPM
jgi:hypothetical protein